MAGFSVCINLVGNSDMYRCAGFRRAAGYRCGGGCAGGDIRVTGAVQINPTAVEVYFSNGQHATLDFYGKNIFRLFVDPSGGILRDPKADPEAQILVDDPRGVCKGNRLLRLQGS